VSNAIWTWNGAVRRATRRPSIEIAIQSDSSFWCGERIAAQPRGMSLPLLKFSGGSVDDYAICLSS
jgi:hypothetical protein